MKGKLLVAVGFGVGYFAGTASGRHRIDQLKARLDGVANDPTVRRVAQEAGGLVAEAIPVVQAAVVSAAERAPEAVKDAASKLKSGVQRGYGSATFPAK